VRGPPDAYEIKPHFVCREANWELVQNYLVNNPNTRCLEGNCSKSKIRVALKHLTDILKSATLYAMLLKIASFKSMQIAASTLTLIQIRHRLRKQWQKAHDITLQRIIIGHLEEKFTSTGHQQHEILEIN
jgi:hypothetical protein